jgi:hypothetical protein
MKHVSTLAIALGLSLVTACGSESAAEETSTPEVPAEATEAAETTTQTTVHYTCASGCGAEKDAAAADGIPQHCGAPMAAKP